MAEASGVTVLLFFATIALAIALSRLKGRVDDLERALHAATTYAEPIVHEMPPLEPVPVPVPTPAPAPAPVLSRPPLHAPIDAAETDVRAPSRPPADFESLVGGRLPIWIGGLALVIGGIFLVRLSIEAGWLTPAIRTAFAAVFAVALLAASEIARRLPATRDDARVGQVLAGAGIASAYATLYLAVALYHLAGPSVGFALMLAITALGLFLAVRHGPPTAVMALIGGFVAPMVAGYDAAGIGPLLGYLAVFVAALLALAIVRGWAWLALSAMAAAFGWAALLIALLPADRLGGVGVFIVALGVAGTLAVPRAGVSHPVLRGLPLLAALVQLLALAPVIDFDGLAWSFYLVLSAAALFLASRDATLLRAAQGASLLVTLLVVAGLIAGDNATPVALPIAMLLFAGTGGALSRRGQGWAVIALTGSAGPLLAAQIVAPQLLAPAGWFAADLLLAAAAAALAWRHRDRRDDGDIGLVGGVAVAALGVGLAVAAIVPLAWIALAPLAAGAVLLVALLADSAAIGRLAAIPWGLLLGIAAMPLFAIGTAIAASVTFDLLPWRYLPPPAQTAWSIVLPAIAVLAAAMWRRALFDALRPFVLSIQTVVAILGTYALLKAALAIGTPDRFVALGFTERAILTDLALVAAFVLWHRVRTVALGLVVLALARIVWFDGIGLNPALVAQQVGSLPVLNAATLHLGLSAAIVWRLRGLPLRHWIAATLTLAALFATVRQVAHGSILTGPVGLAENWGYSAAMLALAIAWLWRGLATGAADLRRLGLTLLTLTTTKVFIVDASALTGVLRILSFMGLGVALIAIGWAYRRFIAPVTATGSASPAGPAPA